MGTLVRDRVVLCWAVNCSSHFCGLKSQAVGLYLPFSPSLCAVQGDKVLYFDVTCKKWGRLYRLSTDLSQYSEGHALTYTLGLSLFICGGRKNPNRHTFRVSGLSKAHYIEAGVVYPLPDMLNTRYSHCVAFVPALNSALVFGGLNNGCPHPCAMRESEKFSLTTGEWEVLPEMNMRRKGINAALLNRHVYLCAGESEGSVEKYDWQANVFVLLSFKLPVKGSCVAILRQNSCLCVSEKATCAWKLEGEGVSAAFPGKACVTMVSAPVVYGKEIYLMDWSECRTFNIATGQPVHSHPYPH